jgi:putative intracellular protease/amidase
MPKVLIFTGDAAESLEVMDPYQRLVEEGYLVDIAAPIGQEPAVRQGAEVRWRPIKRPVYFGAVRTGTLLLWWWRPPGGARSRI